MSHLPWGEINWENDTGPNDDSYWEWYEIPGVGKFDDKEDAKLARSSVNAIHAAGITNPEALPELISVAKQAANEFNRMDTDLSDKMSNEIWLVLNKLTGKQ